MPQHYTFNGGAYSPVEQVDVTAEQEKANAQIQASEDRYFDNLRANDARRLQDTQDFWKSVGQFSKSAKSLADSIYAKRKEEELARGAMLALTGDYDLETIQALVDEEDGMSSEHTRLSGIAGEITNETGSFILGNEIRALSGWERYSFVKNLLIKEAKNYDAYRVENRNEVFITVAGEDGTEVTVGYGEQFDREPNSIEESDALNSKIKEMFVARFGGVNPTLLQLAVKPILDASDDAERSERISDLEQKADALDQQRQIDQLVTAIESNPADGQQYLDRWIDHNKWRNNGDVAITRADLAETLVEAVRSGKLSIVDALGAIQHKFQHRGMNGQMVDYTVFSEFQDIESRLMEANQEFKAGREELLTARIKEEVDYFFENMEDPSEEERVALLRGITERYPGIAIPDDELNRIRGWEDDDIARQRLNIVLADRGWLIELDLEGVSPKVRNEFVQQNVVRATGYEAITYLSQLDKKDEDYIRDLVADNLGEKLGLETSQSPEFHHAMEYVESFFVSEYNAALLVGESPENALDLAKDALRNKLKDSNFRRTMIRAQPATSDFDRQTAMNQAQKQIKPGSEGWKTTILVATEDDIAELKAWAEGGGETPVPSYYAQLAHNNKLFAKELANAQARLLGFKTSDFDVEAAKGDLPENVLDLLLFKPTSEKVDQAGLELENFNNQDNEDHISVWRQYSNLRTYDV